MTQIKTASSLLQQPESDGNFSASFNPGIIGAYEITVKTIVDDPRFAKTSNTLKLDVKKAETSPTPSPTQTLSPQPAQTATPTQTIAPTQTPPVTVPPSPTPAPQPEAGIPTETLLIAAAAVVIIIAVIAAALVLRKRK